MGRWCGLRSVGGERSEAVDGARHVGGNKVTVAVSHRKAVVAAWSAELGRVVIGAGLQGKDKCICAKRVSWEGVKPTHNPGAEG